VAETESDMGNAGMKNYRGAFPIVTALFGIKLVAIKKLARHSRESGNAVGLNKMHFRLAGFPLLRE
jgi:hypothetical protein